MVESGETFVSGVYHAFYHDKASLGSKIREKFPRRDLSIVAPKVVGGESELNSYLDCAEAIKRNNKNIDPIYARLEAYLERRCAKDFFVVCAPSMTGKTQFAFTLNHPTIYVPFALGQLVYKPFTDIHEAIFEAACIDLVKCYKKFEDRCSNLVSGSAASPPFDPLISAENFGRLMFYEESYLLGVFAFLLEAISNSTNAVESTQMIIGKLKSMAPKGETIIPITRAAFQSLKYEKTFVVLDEFPVDDVDQVIAIFVRNVLRSLEVPLILMSTSAKIMNMISPGKSLKSGSGDVDKNLKWATLIRRLPIVSIESLLERYDYGTFEDFKTKLRSAIASRVDESSCNIDHLHSLICSQLQTSRPGLTNALLQQLHETFPLETDEEIDKILGNEVISDLITDINGYLRTRKESIFDDEGFIASMYLIHPDLQISNLLNGPRANDFINNHLFHLADPNGIFRNLPKDVSGYVDLYIKKKVYSENQQKMCAKREARRIKSVKNSPITGQETDILSVVRKRDDKLSVWLDNDCRIRFDPTSEMPSIEKELFAYLGCWGIGNYFFIPSEESELFITKLYENMQKTLRLKNRSAPKSVVSPSNDGLAAEALFLDSIVFSSHYLEQSEQEGLQFLYRMLRNCDLLSKSDGITNVQESGIVEGVSGDLQIHSEYLLNVIKQMIIPYLGPVNCDWSFLMDVFPGFFGRSYRPPNQTNLTGKGIDIRFDYFENERNASNKKIVSAEVKDYSSNFGVHDVVEVLERIDKDTVVHFLFCGPATRTFSSPENAKNYMKNPPRSQKKESEATSGTASQSTSEENKTGLRKVLERKGINLYYVSRFLREDGTVDHHIRTLREDASAKKVSIIIPFMESIDKSITDKEMRKIIYKLETVLLRDMNLGKMNDEDDFTHDDVRDIVKFYLGDSYIGSILGEN